MYDNRRIYAWRTIQIYKSATERKILLKIK